MGAMYKLVNVKASIPVRNVNPPIYGTCSSVFLSVGDILKCLCRRAIVEEIIPGGKIVPLNMKNYNTDNGAGTDARKADFSTKVVEKEPEPAEIIQPAVIDLDEEKAAEEPVVETVEETETATVVETAEEETVTEEETVAETVEETEPVVEEESVETVEETAAETSEDEPVVEEETEVETTTEETVSEEVKDVAEPEKKTTSKKKRSSKK